MADDSQSSFFSNIMADDTQSVISITPSQSESNSYTSLTVNPKKRAKTSHVYAHFSEVEGKQRCNHCHAKGIVKKYS
jgi:hypothetical protein